MIESSASSAMGRLILGKEVAATVRAQVAAQAASLIRKPGLATVLVGQDPASHTYVRSKHRACQDVGFESYSHLLSEDASQAEVESLLRKLADDPLVDGILVQLPLPPHLDSEAVLGLVPMAKDVDGFHPVNIGRLACKGKEPLFLPCTPAGILRLLDESGAVLSGARAVVVGRSNIVGMPCALLLTRRDATVTIVHSRSRDMADIIRQADVVVVAVGKPGFVTGAMLKPGCTVIDVGINRTPDGLVGDVDFESARRVAGAITPVPGGVGPMTIAMLMENTLRAAQRNLG